MSNRSIFLLGLMGYTRFLGHSIFIIHFILALVFVQERTLYADSANFIFHIINEQWFSIGAERYTSIFPQLLPLLAVKLGLPLKGVLLSFSVSYILFYYGLFLLVTYPLKNPPIGLAIALSLFLCVEHNYFMIIFEMTQGVIWCFVLFAFMNRYYEGNAFSTIKFWLIGLSLVVICFLNHPASVFSIVFILVYVGLDRQNYFNVKLIGLLTFLIGMVVAKAMLITSDSYEGSFMSQFENFGALLPTVMDLYSTNFFKKHFMELYLFLTVLLVWVSVVYYRKKMLLKMAFLLVYIGVFMLVTFLLFHSGDSDMMMERVFIQLSVFVLVPLMHEFYREYISLLALKVFFIMMVIMSTTRVVNRGMFYRQRVDYIASILKAHSGSTQAKFIVNQKQLNSDLVLVPWAFSIETLLYSALAGPEHSKTIFLADTSLNLKFDQADKDVFLYTPFYLVKSASSLNQTYFKLPKQEYRVVR